jgi:hypothetical protein
MMEEGKGDRASVGGDRDGSAADPSKPTLSELGIDKHLADRARKLNSLSNKAFENLITKGREDVRRSAERSVLSQATRTRILRPTPLKSGCGPSVASDR